MLQVSLPAAYHINRGNITTARHLRRDFVWAGCSN